MNQALCNRWVYLMLWNDTDGSLLKALLLVVILYERELFQCSVVIHPLKCGPFFLRGRGTETIFGPGHLLPAGDNKQSINRTVSILFDR
jgi:hypothetical protein